MIFVEIFVGAAIGTILGLCGWFFKYIKHWKSQIYLKALWCIAVAIADIIAVQKSGFTESKYIGALLFGYTSFRIWGEDKPNKQIAQAWFFIQPFLFGTVGASLDFQKIDSSMLGYSVIVILVGVLMRSAATFVVTQSKKYNLKERAFMTICWIPKATV